MSDSLAASLGHKIYTESDETITISDNASTLIVEYTSGTVSRFHTSGDVALASKPSWVD